MNDFLVEAMAKLTLRHKVYVIIGSHGVGRLSEGFRQLIGFEEKGVRSKVKN